MYIFFTLRHFIRSKLHDDILKKKISYRIFFFLTLFVSLFPAALKENSSEVVQPFLMGCGTKEPKITQLCLAAIQRLMSHEVVSEVRAIS